MKKILFSVFCMILGISICGCSEDETPGFGSIYGIVTDAETSQPVYGASVILSPGNLSTLTGRTDIMSLSIWSRDSIRCRFRPTDISRMSVRFR